MKKLEAKRKREDKKHPHGEDIQQLFEKAELPCFLLSSTSDSDDNQDFQALLPKHQQQTTRQSRKYIK